MSDDVCRGPLTPEQIAELKASRDRAARMRQGPESQPDERMEMLSELDERLAQGRRKANGKFYGVAHRGRRRRHR